MTSDGHVALESPAGAQSPALSFAPSLNVTLFHSHFLCPTARHTLNCFSLPFFLAYLLSVSVTLHCSSLPNLSLTLSQSVSYSLTLSPRASLKCCADASERFHSHCLILPTQTPTSLFLLSPPICSTSSRSGLLHHHTTPPHPPNPAPYPHPPTSQSLPPDPSSTL